MKKKSIDTHVHFWKIEEYKPYAAWFKEKTFLNRDYLPQELELQLQETAVEGAIIVGAAPDSRQHNLWCGSLVKQHSYLSALIASYSLENAELPKLLDDFFDKPWFVGIRAKPASAPTEWASDAKANKGILELKQRGLKLDMLVDETLLPAVSSLAAQYDDLPIIVNHCGLPPFKDGNLSVWARNMAELALRPNVFVKYSSFFLHCYPNCNEGQLKQAANVLLEHFGTKRLLWGSNWPPELMGGSYQDAFDLMALCAGDLSDDEYNQVFNENARAVYGFSK